MTTFNSQDFVKVFRLNEPQARALMVMANQTWLPWARGTGKTQGVIAPWILHKVEMMPRSSGGLVGQSFEDIETRILTPIFSAFSMLGLVEGQDYIYGKRPPDDWEKPLIPVIKYDRVLSFPNGTNMHLISLAKMGSANGLSLQWLVGDEAKFLNPDKLKQEVFPILRGNVEQFGPSPWYGAMLFVTDKLHPNIHWILKKKELMDESLVRTVLYYQLEVNRLRIEMSNVSDGHAYKYKRKIDKIESVISVLRKGLVYYGEAKASDNIENLSADYLLNMQKSMTKYEYSIQIDNEDPTRVENNFYPNRTEHHLYDLQFDEDVTQPIGITMDYQASISPLVAFQVNEMVIPGTKSLNFLSSPYVLFPLGLRHVIDDFCKVNDHRPCKEVYYFYDHTATAKKNDHKSYYEEVIEYFETNGWIVHDIHMGRAPEHEQKFSRVNYYLSIDNVVTMPIRIHQNRCCSMVLSMDLSATKETEKGTRKDKNPEKDSKYPQEQATHFSDTFDQAIWAVLELELYPMSNAVGMGVAFR